MCIGLLLCTHRGNDHHCCTFTLDENIPPIVTFSQLRSADTCTEPEKITFLADYKGLKQLQIYKFLGEFLVLKCLKADRLCCRRDGSARQPVAMLLRKRLDGGLAPQVSQFIKSGFKSCTSIEVKANKFRRFLFRFKISYKGKSSTVTKFLK